MIFTPCYSSLSKFERKHKGQKTLYLPGGHLALTMHIKMNKSNTSLF